LILTGYEHMLVINMPRPVIPRQVLGTLPAVTFTPGAAPPASLGRAGLTLDGLEALRLADLEGLYQEEAARRMGVSRATFARVLADARRQVADALVNSKALAISGGVVDPRLAEVWPCPVHGEGRRRGRGCRCDTGVEGPPRRRYRSGWESPPAR
jgi:predicted DNA-binding protein (UPF0251 family)